MSIAMNHRGGAHGTRINHLKRNNQRELDVHGQCECRRHKVLSSVLCDIDNTIYLPHPAVRNCCSYVTGILFRPRERDGHSIRGNAGEIHKFPWDRPFQGIMSIINLCPSSIEEEVRKNNLVMTCDRAGVQRHESFRGNGKRLELFCMIMSTTSKGWARLNIHYNHPTWFPKGRPPPFRRDVLSKLRECS
jgi:hypothetical protein